MATAHSLSVITNSCVKQPVNPKTGLSSTIDQRTNAQLSHLWTGRDADYDDPREEWDQRQVLSRSVNFDTTNIDTLGASDLSGLSDDEFYSRLKDLKADHKKTLQMCEDMYNEKLASQRMGNGTGMSPYTVTGTTSRDMAWSQPIHDPPPYDSFNKSLDTLRRSYSGEHYDNVRDMSAAKPPTGKPRASDGTPSKSRKNKRAWAGGRSASEDYWKVQSTTSTDAEMSEEELRITRPSHSQRTPRAQDDSLMSSVSHIEDMWENFSVDEYAPRTRGRSNSMSRLNSARSPASARKQKPVDRSSEWRHKITIPQPFSMTLREANKEKKKTRAMEEVDMAREESILREEAECQKKFKATPVPAHIYMPLYDELVDEQESRRRYNQKVSAQKLTEMQKPFKFTKREEDIRKERSDQRNPLSMLQKDKEEKKQFKANPFPAHIFDNTVNDKIREEEEYRNIRMQMRKEELLRSSSLPPNMAARGRDYTDGKSRQKIYAERARKAGITVEHKFKPRIKGDVPDFDELHRQLQQEMSYSRQQKEATVCKPFNLRTSQVAASRRKIYEDIEMDEETLKENRWPFQNSRSKPMSRSMGLTGSWSSSLDTFPAKMTTSADLRTSANRAKIERQIQRELAELETERRRRLKEKQLKKFITEKAAANDQTVDLKTSNKAKLREYKQTERERAQEYRRQLNEMQDRVGQRPLLFERTSQMSAAQAAERRYRDTLRRAGVDEDFVVRKSSGAGQLDDADEDDRYLNQRSYSDQDSDPESYSQRSRHSYHSQSRSQSGIRDYSDNFDHDTERTDEENSDIVEDY